jgi:hypothetical protein
MQRAGESGLTRAEELPDFSNTVPPPERWKDEVGEAQSARGRLGVSALPPVANWWYLRKQPAGGAEPVGSGDSPPRTPNARVSAGA